MSIQDMIKGKTFNNLLVLFFVLMVLWLRMLYLQFSHFNDAEQYREQANLKLAMREYDTALHLYTPFSPFVERSAEGLWKIGRSYEDSGEPDWAVLAYSSLRSSLYSSQSFYLPGKDWIRKCDRKMAEINAKIMESSSVIDSSDAETEMENFLFLYRFRNAPDTTWSALSIAGFMGWIASMICLCFFAVNGSIRKRPQPFFFGVLSLLVFYVLWCIALLQA